MQLPLAYLDAAAVEEVPLDLWRRVFDATRWPSSLSSRREEFTHEQLLEAIAHDEPADELLQLLEVLHALGTEAGAEAIQVALEDQQVPRESLPMEVGAQELALHLYLAQRQDAALADVFARAQIQVQEHGDHRRYHEFVGRSARRVARLSEKATQLQAVTRSHCESRDLGDHVEVRAFEDDGTYVFQILRSDRTRQRLAVVAGSNARATIRYRPVLGDLVRYEASVGRLRIAARSASIVGFYRRTLGQVLFDDEDYFSGDAVCSLRLLQDRGRSVLENHDVVGIGRVRMTECLWERGDRELLQLRSSDCFRQIEALELPLGEGVLLQAKLKLDIVGESTRPVIVNVRAPSRIEISQKRHEVVVDRFLSQIGIRGQPLPNARPTLWSLPPWRHTREVWESVFLGDTDMLIEQGVLRPVRLERVAHPEDPEAGRTLEVLPVASGATFGVSTVPDLPSRTLTATDLDGFELRPDRLRHLLHSRLEANGTEVQWDGQDETLDIGVVTVGEQRLYLAYATRRPAQAVGERLRPRAAGAPIVLLCPSSEVPATDVPTIRLEHPLPTLRGVTRAAIYAAGLQSVVPAIDIAPEGARLVVDRTRAMVWVDGHPIPSLRPGTHPFNFVTLLAEAMGRPVTSSELMQGLSGARQDGNTAARQAKSAAQQAIRVELTRVGSPLDVDPFLSCGGGSYRCAVPSFVSGN